MPESRHRYFYERLGDHDFQQLVAALLTHRFPDFVPLPLRQSDGGRDGTTRGSDRSLVYQVKWSSTGSEKNPVSWLDATVRDESDNLRRLRKEGVRRYVLVTNVPSTGRPQTGTFDRLNARLDDHARALGLEEISCLWREAVNGMVDDAPDDLLWKYADMLAGWDLIRYLIAEDDVARQSKPLRQLIRAVAAAQWEDDERVKFSQVDIDRERIVDLFIDVHADRLTNAFRADLPLSFQRPDRVGGPSSAGREVTLREPLGAIAAHLLKPSDPGRSVGTLVRGAPGQGKSTLSQFVAQAHRASFVPERLRPATGLPQVDFPLFPIRADLSEYARWMAGVDVWDPDPEMSKKRRSRPSTQATVECFIADLMAHVGGGAGITAEQVRQLFGIVPSIVILDGLDEVGRLPVRKRIVGEIDRFAARCRSHDIPPRVIVTTRPSTNALPEPSNNYFDVVVLNPLQPAQRDEYLRKWTSVRGITGAAGRGLRKTYKEKIAEPYLDELAGNPMQLTILLDLLHKHGEATPTQRTALYDSYVDLLLAREANKHPDSVRKYQAELRQIIPFLGWHMHAHAEVDPVSARMTTADIKATIRHFLQTYGNSGAVVDDLFDAATDRLWALTSKSEGAFEFEVLSLREYFAAWFLYRYAGEDIRNFDRLDVFRELLRRPYWLNTVRFYGGNAQGGAVSELADGLIDELDACPPPQSVIAGWTLLTDGVFTSRPRRTQDLLVAFSADEHLSELVAAHGRGEISALPQLPPQAGEAEPTWKRLTERIAADPDDPGTSLRVAALRELFAQRRAFALWWADRLRSILGDAERVDSWLRIAADCEAAAGLAVDDLRGIDLARPLTAQRLLDSGLAAAPGSKLEADLIQAVLAGRCPEVRSIRSLPAQIAVVFAPASFLTNAFDAFPSTHQRRWQEAVQHLRRDRPDLETAARLRKFRAGQKGSTFPWAASASALFDAVGPCWLVSQIAILGAASPMNLGVARPPGRTAFGLEAHPAELLYATRSHAGDGSWWQAQLDTLTTDDQRAEWCLAFWCVAKPDVLVAGFSTWQRALLALPQIARQPVFDAAFHCGMHGWLEHLPAVHVAVEPEVEVLVAARLGPTIATWPWTNVDDAPKAAASPPGALLDVARRRGWLKVDTVGAYR